jgi:steroid delta-isomerase-like uncharacterized protein
MSTDENKAIMRRFIDAVFNEKRVDRGDEFVARDYLDHSALPGQAPGIEGAKQRWAMFNAAIPDMRTTIEDLVAEGDKVVVRYTVEGTQQGEMMSIPPTGKPFQMTGINITRMAGGKLAEHWEQADMLGMMQQLGVIPAPARTG